MLTPDEILAALQGYQGDLPLAQICAQIYQDYDRALAYRGAVDFQDLIRLALHVLRHDSDFLAALQRKWVYILEDEAQDSSRLQEEILRLLAGESGNWVRVGDPNQAIFETFTTADPKYLREFISAPGVDGRELPNSGAQHAQHSEAGESANRMVAGASTSSDSRTDALNKALHPADAAGRSPAQPA